MFQKLPQDLTRGASPDIQEATKVPVIDAPRRNRNIPRLRSGVSGVWEILPTANKRGYVPIRAPPRSYGEQAQAYHSREPGSPLGLGPIALRRSLL